MKNSLLVFDFFGVICSEIAPYWLVKYFSDEDAVMIKKSCVYRADIGKISQNQLFQELANLAKITPAQVEKEWMDLVSIDQDVLQIMKSYQDRCETVLLTNAPSPFVRKIIKDYSLDVYFSLIVVSSEVRLAKPHPEIYHHLLNRLDAHPANSIMIDDNKINIDAAISVGMKGIHYICAEKLEFELGQLVI